MTVTEIPTTEILWTTEALAAYLSIPVATLHTWRSRGKGPRAIKVGRHLRYRRIDVDAWLESQAA